MRVRTFLRRIREQQQLSIRDVCARTGLALGEVSMFERGHSIPREDQAQRMIAVYGAPDSWYPRGVFDVLMPDLRDCPGCGDELDPDASRRRKYHSDECRNEYRRLLHVQLEPERRVETGPASPHNRAAPE